jgi:probable phosphoglycerate mutase
MPTSDELTMPTAQDPASPTGPVMRVIPDQSNSFYFVRHGATEPNLRELRCGGDLDLPMSDLGREQARASADRILAMKIGVGLIVCGTLKRTREHAAILSKALGGVPIITEPLLDERHMGEWNLRSVADTEVLLKQGIAPPSGESEQAIVARVTAAFERFQMLLPLNPLVVSSRAVARVLNLLLGGSGRLNVANGEIVQFKTQPPVSPTA